MGIIGSILFVLFLGDFLWWWRADRALRRLPRTHAWRIALAIFSLVQAIGLALVLLDRAFDFSLGHVLTSPWLTVIYIWHCLLLFPMILIWVPYMAARGVVLGIRRLVVGRHPVALGSRAANGGQEAGMTRRDFTRLLGTAAPALVTLGAGGIAIYQIEHFRLRRMEIALPDLPPALDGLTIAHVTDLHVGQFTRGEVLDRIVAATNDLGADLVLLTGDLINFALSDLDSALGIVQRLKGTHGVFMCEGNHDLFEDPAAFRQRTRAAGVSLLVNESTVVPIRGENVQLLGLRWGGRSGSPRDPENRGDQAIAESARELLLQKRPDAFPILLAHHPHAFDFAGTIPLTLAGHTHGGQLMVTEKIGFGPMLYRYWSGLYRKDNRALVVSNGTGNWFPLRSRAPAEIIHLTLRKA